MALLRASLPSPVVSSLRDEMGGRPRVLAWAEASDGLVVGLPDRMMLQEPDGSWRSVGWHLIDTGRWDEASSTLTWETSEGTEAVTLEDGQRFADLFTERVTTSIIAHRRLPVGTSSYVVVAMRRDLGDHQASPTWQVRGGPGVDLEDPDVAALVSATLERLRTEYDFA